MIKNKKPFSSWRCGVFMVLALVMVLCLVACRREMQEPLRAPLEEKATATISIETTYGTLEFPEELYANLRHMEVIEDSLAMEVFYMVGTKGEKELYRIHYADGQAGIHLGYMATENGEIPVSYSICEYADENFADEEERKLYYSMMDAFSVVMNSIYADERFSETRVVAPVGSQEVALRHWKVTLPANVEYTETEENGNYRVVFYGMVGDERIDLYMIGLGNLEAETTLGMYTVNGVQKSVMVETFSLAKYSTWPEEDQMVIYKMMDSINDVIQTIVTDKNFGTSENAE